MQLLLDFIHEHSVESQLYCVIDTPDGELEAQWQRHDCPEHWRVRPKGCEAPWELVLRAELLGSLQRRNANMASVEQQLHAHVATQIVFADMLLRDARELLGSDAVRTALHSYREFVVLLQASIRQLLGPARPSLQLVPGEASQTPARTGHLTVIR